MARLVADLQKRMERTEVRTKLWSQTEAESSPKPQRVHLSKTARSFSCFRLTFVLRLLSLLQPVTVVKDISDQSVFTNKDAVFECEIKINYPEITLSWYKGTQKLDTNNKYDISISGDRHLLKVKKCQTSDQGNYRVVCGPHISSAKLTVMGQYFCCAGSGFPVCDAREPPF